MFNFGESKPSSKKRNRSSDITPRQGEKCTNSTGGDNSKTRADCSCSTCILMRGSRFSVECPLASLPHAMEKNGSDGATLATPTVVGVENSPITPYESYLVTLSVGPLANPVQFHVHSSSLQHIRFFAAAIREGAFLEGREKIIRFEEEDPAVFRRLVEFVYTSRCFPRHFKYPDPFDSRNMFEVSTPIIRKLAGAEPQEYRRWLATSMSCGAHVTVDETHEIVKMVVETMCLGERYGYQALVDDCLDKIYDLPFGLREVTLLTELVLEQIPETERTIDIYRFLRKQLHAQKSRLYDYQAFRSLLRGPLFDDVLNLMSATKTIAAEFIKTARTKGKTFAVCIEEVTVERSAELFGSDETLPLKFGEAKVGEVIMTEADGEEGDLITGTSTDDFPRLIFPMKCFRLLGSALPRRVIE